MKKKRESVSIPLEGLSVVKREKKSILLEGLKIASKKTNIKKACPDCGSLRIWKNGHSRGTQKYKCADCKKEFRLESKPRVYKPKEPKKLVCPKCGSEHTQKKGFTKAKVQVYRCRDCKRYFQTEYADREYREPRKPCASLKNLCKEFKDISVKTLCHTKIFQLAKKSNPHLKIEFKGSENHFYFKAEKAKTEFLEKVNGILEKLREQK